MFLKRCACLCCPAERGICAIACVSGTASSNVGVGTMVADDDWAVHFFSSWGQCFRCPNCQRAYHHRRSLQRHLTCECGKEPQFKCPHCPQRCKLKCNLLKHMRACHLRH
ncbi:hypothetical protein PR048_000171 [Dryococelus australis]|uniref:C2H2-type domain-containing protein n=1 Tax=Dryococelus australis TaxID=614101 RepID=A0ABQ9IF25_9NEOP|nr:hypothetical protein PR048_000171 [Dryococelus australis]